MLILTRRMSEKIMIGSNVEVIVLGIKGNQVRIGVEAPPSIEVDREELRERKARDPGFNPGEVK